MMRFPVDRRGVVIVLATVELFGFRQSKFAIEFRLPFGLGYPYGRSGLF